MLESWLHCLFGCLLGYFYKLTETRLDSLFSLQLDLLCDFYLEHLFEINSSAFKGQLRYLLAK